MKGEKIIKKILFFMLMLFIALGSHMAVQAEAKMPKYAVSLNKSVYTLKKGKTVKLKATLNKDAKKEKIIWSSSNKKVAVVSAKGKVTAKKNGKAKITAKVKGTKVKAVCTINVGTPVKSIRFGQKAVSLKIGEKFQLKTTITPKKAAVKKVSYKSSDSKVVSVSKKGVILAVAKGKAQITVTASDGSGKKAVCTVTVKEADVGKTPSDPSEETSEEPDVKPEDSNILVAYFSWSGTSERIAKNIIEQTGADEFRIERETPYSTDYTETAYGDAKMEAEQNARPPIKAPLASVAQYEKIILCYPIWWHTAPMTIGTFLESYDFSGKQIYPISQSASMDRSQYEQSVTFVRECAKGAIVDDGIFSKNNAVIQEYVRNTVLQEKE